MNKAVYPGSFDPITMGHLDVIYRSSQLFDRVDIVVAPNTAKKSLFSVDERLELIRECTKGWENVRVEQYEGLIVNYLRDHEARVIIRGLRALSDFEFEFQLALMNKKLAPNIETIYLMPRENYTYLNSSIIKEIVSMDGDVSEFVPPNVELALKEKFKKKKSNK